MFNLFKKKSATSALEAKYKKVMEEAFKLSKINRTASDVKYAEADEIQKEIQLLMKKE